MDLAGALEVVDAEPSRIGTPGNWLEHVVEEGCGSEMACLVTSPGRLTLEDVVDEDYRDR